MGKKYKVSSMYTGLFISVTVVTILIIVLCLCIAPPKVYYRELFLPFSVFFLGIIYYLYKLLFDDICGSFSVDDKGINMFVGLSGYKTYFHPWESIKDCGTTWTRTANDGGTYCIYFSTRRLTIAEKQKFLWKTRRDLDNIAYFQYSEETMAEIYPVLPPEIAAKVKENVELVESSMNSFERRHHK